MCIGDRRGFVPFASACDYKRAGDGDTGPNTGGMGAYSPPSGFPDDMLEIVRQRILEPVATGLRAEGEGYIGVLYCGLMWTKSGPYVIEFNARFGDPETQVLMPRVGGDFARLLKSAAEGRTDADAAHLSTQACVGVVLCTPNYPHSSTPVHDLPSDAAVHGAQLFWGTTTLRDGRVDAAGGRVVTVAALGDNVTKARENAYDAVRELGRRLAPAELTCRRDIARDVQPVKTISALSVSGD